MAKQMKRYPAKFDREDDGRYSVFFLGSGMDGCITYGDDIEDARRNAKEALEAYLGYFSDRGSIMPEPEEILGDGIEYIALG